jgi:uncharacterized protein
MKWIVAVGLIALAAYLVSSLERRSLYFPFREIGGTPKSIGLAYESVTLTAKDGVKIHAWWIPAKDARLSVLFSHGNAGNISHRLEKLKILHNLGLNVLMFDYRGYGESEGIPTEKGTYLDAEAAYDHLLLQRSVPKNRIVFVGESLGCAVATELAVRHPAAAMILESPFTSTIAMGKLVFPWLPVKAIVRYKYDNLEKISRLTLPLLILHSEDDEIVPFAMGQALFAASKSPAKRFVELQGGHNDGFLTSEKIYGHAIKQFLEDILKGDPT